MEKNKFYRNALEEINDAFKRTPEIENYKDFVSERIDKDLMKGFLDYIWDLLKPKLTFDADLPLIVSRDPVSTISNVRRLVC